MSISRDSAEVEASRNFPTIANDDSWDTELRR